MYCICEKIYIKPTFDLITSLLELPPHCGGGRFVYANDPRTYIVGGFMPMVGPPMANRSGGMDQTRSSSEDPYDEQEKWKPVFFVWTWALVANDVLCELGDG